MKLQRPYDLRCKPSEYTECFTDNVLTTHQVFQVFHQVSLSLYDDDRSLLAFWRLGLGDRRGFGCYPSPN